jgi:hypothetical protein
MSDFNIFLEEIAETEKKLKETGRLGQMNDVCLQRQKSRKPLAIHSSFEEKARWAIYRGRVKKRSQ